MKMKDVLHARMNLHTCHEASNRRRLLSTVILASSKARSRYERSQKGGNSIQRISGIAIEILQSRSVQRPSIVLIIISFEFFIDINCEDHISTVNLSSFTNLNGQQLNLLARGIGSISSCTAAAITLASAVESYRSRGYGAALEELLVPTRQSTQMTYRVSRVKCSNSPVERSCWKEKACMHCLLKGVPFCCDDFFATVNPFVENIKLHLRRDIMQ
jgi:hypothetical protein